MKNYLTYNGKLLKTPDNKLLAIEGSSAVLGTKEITANGTYNAVDDSLDGYSAVTVDVPTSGGEIPTPTDGKTHAFISLRPTTGKVVTLYFYSNAGTLYVDWGDNTPQFTSTATGALNTGGHAYADYGDYEITIWTSSGTVVFFQSQSKAWIVPTSVLTRMYYGSSTEINTEYALYACGGVEYIDASLAGGSYIGNRAFYSLYSLKTFILPAGLTSLGGYTIANAYSLSSLVFNSVTPPNMTATTALSGINKLCKIYVPDASVTAYKEATNWATYAKYIYPMSEMEA